MPADLQNRIGHKMRIPLQLVAWRYGGNIIQNEIDKPIAFAPDTIHYLNAIDPHRTIHIHAKRGGVSGGVRGIGCRDRSEEHTSELQSLMRISYAVFCLKKKKRQTT